MLAGHEYERDRTDLDDPDLVSAGQFIELGAADAGEQRASRSRRGPIILPGRS